MTTETTEKEFVYGETAEELQTVADTLADTFGFEDCSVMWRTIPPDEKTCGFYMPKFHEQDEFARVFINVDFRDGSISPERAGTAVDCLLHEFAHHLLFERYPEQEHTLLFLATLIEVATHYYKDPAKYDWEHEYAWIEDNPDESDLTDYDLITWLRSLKVKRREPHHQT